MRRLLTALALVVAMLGWAPQSQADNGYTPDVPTECNIDVPVRVAGKRVVLEATVTANTNATVTGTVRVRIAKGGSAARGARVLAAREIYTTTVRYDGSTVRIQGPRLPRGSYIASMRFTPDSDLYGACADSTGFQIGGKGAGGETGGEGDNAGLPNTGGPHLMILLLGLGLVTAGGGVVSRTRRTA